jgi:hypothetical protein
MDGDRNFLALEELDISEGKRFQLEVMRRYNSSVHHPSSSPSGGFHLLAGFRRYSFHLSERSVGLALHSVLGGAPTGFHIKKESERHFRFVVASKNVGLHIVACRRIIAKNFDVYFFLWRDGGANWCKEFDLWQREEDESWIPVSKKSSHVKKKLNSVRFPNNLLLPSPPCKSSPRLSLRPSTSSLVSSVSPYITVGSMPCPVEPPVLTGDPTLGLVEMDCSNALVKTTSVFSRLNNCLALDHSFSFGSRHSGGGDRVLKRFQVSLLFPMRARGVQLSLLMWRAPQLKRLGLMPLFGNLQV